MKIKLKIMEYKYLYFFLVCFSIHSTNIGQLGSKGIVFIEKSKFLHFENIIIQRWGSVKERTSDI